MPTAKKPVKKATIKKTSTSTRKTTTTKRPATRATVKKTTARRTTKKAAPKKTVRRSTTTKKTISPSAASRMGFEDIIYAYEDMKDEIIDSIGDIVDDALTGKRSKAARKDAQTPYEKAIQDIEFHLWSIEDDTKEIRKTLDKHVKKSSPRKGTTEARMKQADFTTMFEKAVTSLNKKKVVSGGPWGPNPRRRTSGVPLIGPRPTATRAPRRGQIDMDWGDWFGGSAGSFTNPFELAGHKLQQFAAHARMRLVRDREIEAGRDAVGASSAADVIRGSKSRQRNRTPLSVDGASATVAAASSSSSFLDALSWVLPFLGRKGVPIPKPRAARTAPRGGMLASMSSLLTGATVGGFVFGKEILFGKNGMLRNTAEGKKLIEKYGYQTIRKAVDDVGAFGGAPGQSKQLANPHMSPAEVAVQVYLDKQRSKRRGDGSTFHYEHPVAAGMITPTLNWIGDRKPGENAEAAAARRRRERDIKNGWERYNNLYAPRNPRDGAQLPSSPYSSHFGYDREKDMRNSAGRIHVSGPSSRPRLPVVRPRSLMHHPNVRTHGNWGTPKKSLMSRAWDYMTTPWEQPKIDAKKALIELKKYKVKSTKYYMKLIYLLGELAKVQAKIKQTYANSFVPEMADVIAAPLKDEEARLIEQLMRMGFRRHRKGSGSNSLSGGSGSDDLSGNAGSDTLMPGASQASYSAARTPYQMASLGPSFVVPQGFSQRLGGMNRSYGTYMPYGGSQGFSGAPGSSWNGGGGMTRRSPSLGTSDTSTGSVSAPPPPRVFQGGPLAGANVGAMIPSGTKAETRGRYRPAYKITDADVSDEVIRTIAGEAIVSNPKSVDGVINVMLNRVGSKEYGPSGNLAEVARAQGQFAGYNKGRPTKAQAEMIRKRIRELASGNVPDITNGANEFRAASYGGPWAQKHARDGVVIGGNRFAKNSKSRGAYHTYDTPKSESSGWASSVPLQQSTWNGGTSAKPFDGKSRVNEMQGSTARVRRRPLQSKIHNALEYAAAQNGVQVEVFSGGQAAKGSGGARTGSTRHDLGGAADYKLYEVVNGKKRYLDMTNPNDQAKMAAFNTSLGQTGVITGVGAHPNYMGTQAMHAGGGPRAVWGAGESAAGAPEWLKRAVEKGWKNPIDLDNWVASQQTKNARVAEVAQPTINMTNVPVQNRTLGSIKKGTFGLPADAIKPPPPAPTPPKEQVKTPIHAPDIRKDVAPKTSNPVKQAPAPIPVMGNDPVPSSFKKSVQKAKNQDSTVAPATNAQGITSPYFV